jgi:hypothetical protein
MNMLVFRSRSSPSAALNTTNSPTFQQSSQSRIAAIGANNANVSAGDAVIANMNIRDNINIAAFVPLHLRPSSLSNSNIHVQTSSGMTAPLFLTGSRTTQNSTVPTTYTQQLQPSAARQRNPFTQSTRFSCFTLLFVTCKLQEICMNYM